MMRKVIGTASGTGSRSFRIAEFEADGVGWESGSLWTRCWRKVDSNPRSPCGGWRLGLLPRSYGKFRRAKLDGRWILSWVLRNQGITWGA